MALETRWGGALALRLVSERGDGAAKRSLQRRTLRRRLLILADRMTHLATGVSAIPTKRKVAALQVMHAEMEESHQLLSASRLDLCVDAQVHVAV